MREEDKKSRRIVLGQFDGIGLLYTHQNIAFAKEYVIALAVMEHSNRIILFHCYWRPYRLAMLATSPAVAGKANIPRFNWQRNLVYQTSKTSPTFAGEVNRLSGNGHKPIIFLL